MKLQTRRGFTIEELLIVMGIIAILAGFVTINLFGAKHTASLNTTIDTLISDLKYQQLKAFVGDTEGRSANSPYGMHFEQDQYILFYGNIYSSAEPTNFKVKLGDNIQANNILFPNSEIIFTSGSGEVAGFTDGQDSISIKNMLSNEQKTIKVNRYGVITQIN